jgi:hypothetical protein
MKIISAWMITAVAATAITGLVAIAQDKPAPVNGAPKSAGPSLDELLNIPAPKPAVPAPAKKDGEAPKAKDAMTDPSKIKIAGDEPAGDAFELAVTDMKQAASRLGEQADPGIETQRAQERAIRRLDQLINDQQKQQNSKKQKGQKQDSGSKKQEQQPQQQSGKDRNKGQVNDSSDRMERKGEIEDGKRKDEPLTEKLAEWGNLPPRLRDQLLQGMEDRFSTIYKQLTERYYKRLAEESQP